MEPAIDRLEALREPELGPEEEQVAGAAGGDGQQQHGLVANNNDEEHVEDFMYEGIGTIPMDPRLLYSSLAPAPPVVDGERFFRGPMNLRKRVLLVWTLVTIFREGKTLIDQWNGTGTPKYAVRGNCTTTDDEMSCTSNTTFPSSVLLQMNRFMLFVFSIWLYNFLRLTLNLLEIFGCIWRKFRMSYFTPTWFTLSRQGSFLIWVGTNVINQGADMWKSACEGLQDFDYSIFNEYYQVVEEYVSSMYKFDVEMNELIKTMLKQVPLVILALITMKCRVVLDKLLAGGQQPSHVIGQHGFAAPVNDTEVFKRERGFDETLVIQVPHAYAGQERPTTTTVQQVVHDLHLD